jgi:hypothetical protein
MSATKQIRIRSKEGVVLTKNGVYKTTIDIDGYGQSDLARSYLVLKVAFKNGMGGLIASSENVYLGDIASGTLYDGQCFVRNCRLTCQQFGVVEENLKINVYHQTLRRFTEGTQVEQSRQVFGNERLTTDENGVANIIVPLSSLLGCGNQVYPNSMMGQSTLTLELEFVLDIAFELTDDVGGQDYILTLADISGVLGNTIQQVRTNYTFDSVATASSWFSVGASASVEGDVSGVPLDETETIALVGLDASGHAIITFTAPIYTFTGTATFDNGIIFDTDGIRCEDAVCDNAGDIYLLSTTDFPEPAPLVGFEYGVGYVDASAVAHYTSGVLLEYDELAGTLLFSKPIISASPLEDITDIFIVPKSTQPLSWEVQQTDLVLHKLLQETPMKQFQYETYSVEQTNQPATLQYRKQFQLEADAMSFVYMTPLDSLIGEQNLSASYRWTLNNIDLTNRNIPINRNTSGSLYYDRLLMNVDGIQQLNPSPVGNLLATIYPERAPMGQNNMAELMLDGDGSTSMEGCVGHLFKTRVKVLGGK